MGVWIEIVTTSNHKEAFSVTPYMGVWIEIKINSPVQVFSFASLPTWECGLKCIHKYTSNNFFCVTPYMGVWIEIEAFNATLGNDIRSLPTWECGLKLLNKLQNHILSLSHSLHGSVD